jgi:asparagine synthase (glutamine-hydrolysing)
MDDMNSMYYSVENRSPFLDTELFEWAYQIPTRHLIRNGRAKALLREAVRGVCCDSVIDNPRKVGFNAPIEDYLDLKNGDDKEFLMQDSPIFEFVYRDKIEEYLKKESFTNSESKFLFSFICAKIFMEGYGG